MNKLKIFLKSFLSLFAIMRLTQMSTRSPLSILIFIILSYVFYSLDSQKLQSHIKYRDIVLSSILGVLFSVFTLAAQYTVIIGGLTNMMFCLIVMLASAIGLFVIYFHLCIWVFQACDYLPATDIGITPVYLPYIAFAACIICCLPYFLYEYPAIMNPDSVNQFCQVMGVYELSNHHSIVHTGIIGLCYNIGYGIFHNVYAAIAFYTIVQIAFMAFSAGYVVSTMQKANIRTSVIIIAICFYALMPYNISSAVTMLKDDFFAGNMVIFAATLVRLMLHDKNEKFNIHDVFTTIIPYIISGIMVCLLRGNGWYAFVASLPFIIYTYRKSLKTILPMNIAILIVVLFVKYPFMEIYEIKQADFAESISIPVQQIARVIVNGEQLSDSEYEYVSQIMDIEQAALVYEPDVSDNIKNLIRTTGLDYITVNKSEFFKTWFSIGIKHPKAYFEAFVDQTVGYWYPDVDSSIGLADGIFTNPLGLTWQPVIDGSALIKIKEIIFKLPGLIPLYGLLWSIGFVFWVILILGGLCIRNEKTSNAIVLLPFIMLTLTLWIATPVANDFRYYYAVFYAFPLLLIAPFMEVRH